MKKNIKYIIIALIFITITSELSPIYPMNTWCDTNSFFTMGKAMFRGVSIYKDLFEQKGPFLYLIYGIGYLISNINFFGVFILEVISFSIFLKIMHKILELLEYKNSNCLLIIYTFIITTSISFAGGGSAEEFCFPFIAFNNLVLLKIVHDKQIQFKEYIFNGISAGLVFIIKFNLIAFWIPTFILLIIKKVKFKEICAFVIPILLPIILSLIYFLIKDSMLEYIDTYVIKNLFLYNTNNSMNIIESLLMRIIDMGNDIFINFILITSILLIYSFEKKNMKYHFIIIFIPFYFICCQKTFHYYYTLPFYIPLLLYITPIYSNINMKSIYLILLLIPLTFLLGKHTYILKYKKEDFVQYKFSEIINKYEDKSLLNYNFIDSGFYLRTNVTPNIKFFHKMNFEQFVEMEEKIDEYIRNKQTNFIVIRHGNNDFGFVDDIVKQNYQLITVEKDLTINYSYYGLYIKK